ncbi:DUF6889 family protein [Pantoea agglomerans]|uniref:DUF6889 family protein n=1 Tax=Enterobacter agglomerans TaxID=549 RepID=UPI001CCB8017|nr:NTP pyrophosphohydrolase [Pantoea agglomerans]UBN53042.1 NTP pyrophosphohydrolase [Pantoea agglomerans]
MRPVDAGYISYSALKDGSVDLADIARMNDWLDLKADNNNRIERWRKANERSDYQGFSGKPRLSG